MIDLIQTAPIEAAVIADFQRFLFGDAPFCKRIIFVFDSPGLIGGNANIVLRVVFALESVDLLVYKVRFELSGTPAHTDTRPAVSVQRDAHLLPELNCSRLLLRLLKHEPFKALRMPQHCHVNTAFMEKMLIQAAQVLNDPVCGCT